ncbi:hypothetical protein RFI_04889, partial [Reticulomyxa filosa]
MQFSLIIPLLIFIATSSYSENEKENKQMVEIPDEWKNIKTQIETLEKKLKEWDEEKRVELNGLNWDDIWSFDGEFQKIKKKFLIRMDDIPLIIKTLLSYQPSIRIDVKKASKDFEEITERQKSIQQKIHKKCLEKIELKKQVDEAILKYTKCVEQYNNLCSIERDILIEKQQKEQKFFAINQIREFDNK